MFNIEELEKQYNIKILYLTKLGSHLYGTNNENSDTDYKGIYLPSKESLLLKQDQDFIKLDTNNTNQKNTSLDIDCHLDSLHKWLHLLEKGETSAIDTLFSMWSKDTIVYKFINTWSLFSFVDYVKNHYLKLITSKPHAFVGYCLSQVKKYNIKGERYKELVSFITFLKTFNISNNNRIETLKSWIQQHISDYKYIKYVEAPAPRGTPGNWLYLEILGRKYSPTVSIEYLLEACQKLEQGYGSRVTNTEIDWKALSHAVRVILEIEELLTTSKIVFPLSQAPYIYSIKQGKEDFDDVIQFITQKIEIIDNLLEVTALPHSVDISFQKKTILSLYGE